MFLITHMKLQSYLPNIYRYWTRMVVASYKGEARGLAINVSPQERSLVRFHLSDFRIWKEFPPCRNCGNVASQNQCHLIFNWTFEKNGNLSKCKTCRHWANYLSQHRSYPWILGSRWIQMTYWPTCFKVGPLVMPKWCNNTAKPLM